MVNGHRLDLMIDSSHQPRSQVVSRYQETSTKFSSGHTKPTKITTVQPTILFLCQSEQLQDNVDIMSYSFEVTDEELYSLSENSIYNDRSKNTSERPRFSFQECNITMNIYQN